MGRKRVGPASVEKALSMRDDGFPVEVILRDSGLSQGTYYKYVHEHERDVERRYADEQVRSPLTWPGSKSSELGEILPHVPKFDGRYVEPFLGGGSVFFALKPERSLLSDASTELVEFYGAVRDRYRRFRSELLRLEAEHAEADEEGRHQLYARMRDILNGAIRGDVSVPAAFYYVNKTSYSGLIRRNRRGEYNVPRGRGKSFSASGVTELHARALRDANLHCCDFEETLMRCGPDDFAFIDPPYDSAFADYAGRFGEGEHRRLAEVFRELPCPALMVVGRTPLTVELYGDDVMGEYVREYGVNVRGRITSSSVHLLVGHRL